MTVTTTVRFDDDRWQELCRQADRLGVARAKFIHDATIARVAGADAIEHLTTSFLERLVTERIAACFGRRQRTSGTGGRR